MSILLATPGCKKDNHPPAALPPVTQKGNNTFGCKINGKVWVPYFECKAFTNPCGELKTTFLPVTEHNLLPFIFDFVAQRKVGDDYSAFTISNLYSAIHQTGNVFDSLSVQFQNKAGVYTSFGYQNLYINASDNFTITTLDTANKIMSGTFAFVLRKGSDSLVVTDGRFDFSMADLCQCNH